MLRFQDHFGSDSALLWIPLLIVSLSICSCSTYRKQSRGYRVGSDYGGHGPASEGYSPRGPFQVTWPVRRVKVNRGFRPASDRQHEGVDLGGKRGTPILAAHQGIVIYTGSDFRGYGKMVLVEFNSEWATLYGHLSTIDVEPGQVVEAGETLGGMGNSGQASGVHLHFELLHNRSPIDPLPYLTRINRFARAL